MLFDAVALFRNGELVEGPVRLPICCWPFEFRRCAVAKFAGVGELLPFGRGFALELFEVAVLFDMVVGPMIPPDFVRVIT